VQLAIPEKGHALLKGWLERWIALAGIQPGEPVFRAFKGGHILPQRIASETVLAIVRQRMRAYALATGKALAEAILMANAFSDAMLGRYIASADGWGRSGLAGVGF
jgi:hypothetical protein